MKAVGLITEYNPFHNGHAHHLQESVKLSGADVSIAVMSGNFVQRGIPAFINKYARCTAAVDAGVNLVVELPVCYALSSAELFADGAVRTLQALNVESIVFGSECGNIDMLTRIAQVIAEEPALYQSTLKTALAAGKTFPVAREEAVRLYFERQHDLQKHVMSSASPTFTDLTSDEHMLYSNLLSCPNNILGIEYIKAAIKHQYNIRLHTIKRKGAGYHESKLTEDLPSATALRSMIESNIVLSEEATTSIKSLVPHTMYQLLIDQLNVSYPIELNDFTMLLNYRLSEIFQMYQYQKSLIIDHLCTYTDINHELASRIYSCFSGMDNFYEYAMQIKTRQYTFSRICRCLLHILLDLTRLKSNRYFDGALPPYIRILGFDSLGQQYLHQIKKRCDTPIITKTADYKELMTEDLYASRIYNQVVFHKFKTAPVDEFRHGIYRKA